MLDHPRLIMNEDEEPRIEVTLEPPADRTFAGSSREPFSLSTRAIGLVVDDLEYGHREEIASVTTTVLFLTEGAYDPDDTRGAEEIIQRLHLPESNKHCTDQEVETVAEYLKASELEAGVRWLAEELAADSPLSDVLSANDIRTNRDRLHSLRGIAKDL